LRVLFVLKVLCVCLHIFYCIGPFTYKPMRRYQLALINK